MAKPYIDMDLIAFQRRFGTEGLSQAPLHPALARKINIGEDEENVYVDCEVPGLEIKDLNISLANSSLSIKRGKKTTEGNFYRDERPSGIFQRVLQLNVKINAEALNAMLRDGILRLVLPNSEEHKNKEIAKQEKVGHPAVRPATDIIEKEDGFHIYLDMPGVKKDNLAIDLNDNELTVSAKSEYLSPDEKRQRKYHHMEFGEVSYSRIFTVSDVVDREKIAAKLVNDVVELLLPKSERVVPKRIEISAV